MTNRRKKANDSNGISGSEPNLPAEVSSPTESTELLSIVQAAELILSKAAELCARQSRSQKVMTVSESQSFPKYVGEARVAEITGVSRAWLQRARSEGIGPRHKKIARRVVYRLDQVLDWVESGASALEHLSQPRPKKLRLRKAERDGGCVDNANPRAPPTTATY